MTNDEQKALVHEFYKSGSTDAALNRALRQAAMYGGRMAYDKWQKACAMSGQCYLAAAVAENEEKK